MTTTDTECAQLYRFLRDAPGEPACPEGAYLWELLITKGCRGEAFDATVRKLMAIEDAIVVDA
jgi:hypothetical protein